MSGGLVGLNHSLTVLFHELATLACVVTKARPSGTWCPRSGWLTR